MRTIKNLILLAASASALLVSCTKNQDLHPSSTQATNSRSVTPGPFANGFFLINEGWYGHGTGEVNFYSYLTGTLSDSIFGASNPGKNLNPATSTLE